MSSIPHVVFDPTKLEDLFETEMKPKDIAMKVLGCYNMEDFSGLQEICNDICKKIREFPKSNPLYYVFEIAMLTITYKIASDDDKEILKEKIKENYKEWGKLDKEENDEP
tara:strand:+ start:1056 stop:1385 length:330 start_codon:yes stop_codon:yes gene_type:complete